MQFKLTEQNNQNKGKTGEKERTLRQRHPQNHKTNNKPNEPAQKKTHKKRKTFASCIFLRFADEQSPQKRNKNIFVPKRKNAAKGNFCVNATCECIRAKKRGKV